MLSFLREDEEMKSKKEKSQRKNPEGNKNGEDTEVKCKHLG